MDFWLSESSGMLLFVIGIAGLLITIVAAILIHRGLAHMEKKIRNQIWREYR